MALIAAKGTAIHQVGDRASVGFYRDFEEYCPLVSTVLDRLSWGDSGLRRRSLTALARILRARGEAKVVNDSAAPDHASDEGSGPRVIVGPAVGFRGSVPHEGQALFGGLALADVVLADQPLA